MNHKVLLFLFLFLSFLFHITFSNDVLTNNSNAVKAAVGLPDKLIIPYFSAMKSELNKFLAVRQQVKF